LQQEKHGPPLPNPTANNKNLRLYTDAIRDVAKKRGHRFIDLYELLGKEKHPLTEDGVHLTPWGYWRSAAVLERALGFPEANPRAQRWKKLLRDDRIPSAIEVTLDMLPLPPPPTEGAPPNYRFQKPFIEVEGAKLRLDPAEAEKLRQTIVAKNRLYFHRWRPQNETYLFGFRKYEQGQNAREIPQFDPLIAEKEKEIAKLRVPKSQMYEKNEEKKQ
jgi:hypothetical protein